MEEVNAEWGIRKENVQIAVTDNADNIRKAAQSVYGRSKWLGCFAHALNLVCIDTVKSFVVRMLALNLNLILGGKPY